MSKEMVKFSRWNPSHKNSWPYRIFNQYSAELNRIVMAYTSASKFTYSGLKQKGATWNDKANKYLYTNNDNEITIRNWSDTFNQFDNWVRLNELLAVSAYFETYLSAIISLSFESDPGLLIGSRHSIDGIKILKEGHKFKKDDFKDKIVNCTKGDWNSRISYMSSIFGLIPESFVSYKPELEKMRNLRNKIGHAFGRDIELSRDYSLTKINNMEILKISTFLKYQKMIKKLASDLDNLLMNNHIGNFQPLYYYHNHYPSFLGLKNNGERMMALKKSIGKNTAETYSKDFCRWVVKYYDEL